MIVLNEPTPNPCRYQWIVNTIYFAIVKLDAQAASWKAFRNSMIQLSISTPKAATWQIINEIMNYLNGRLMHSTINGVMYLDYYDANPDVMNGYFQRLEYLLRLPRYTIQDAVARRLLSN